MIKRKNYINYFCNNVDEEELPAYVNEAIFDFIELFDMNETEIYKEYGFNECSNDYVLRKVLKKMLKKLSEINDDMVYKNYHQNYFG